MSKGIKKHLKRLNAPKNWALDKLGGIFAPIVSKGPHKKNSSIPLSLIIKNKLKYALNSREIKHILVQKNLKVDNKYRTDKNFSVGIMDVVSIVKTNERFRLLYSRIGKFILHRISNEECYFKPCKVLGIMKGKKGIPFLTTHDGRTIIYPDTNIKVNDTILVDITSGKIIDYIKFGQGSMCLIIGGSNKGKVGVITHESKNGLRENTLKIKDFNNLEFETKLKNVFVIGRGYKSYISLPDLDLK